MKGMILGLLLIFAYCCNEAPGKISSVELITDTTRQDSIFTSLLTVTNNAIPDNIHHDSLAFLILPLQASCPSCRKKTVDSIIMYRKILLAHHFIILSAKGGKKTINSYFKEEDAELPELPGQIFLDSTNLAAKYDLYDEKPTMYYTYRRKAFKKVASVPSTVKADLHQFFSGKHYSELLEK